MGSYKYFDGFDRERGYHWRVRVSLKTGRISWIRAGCRTWKSAHEVREHYEGRGPYAPLMYCPPLNFTWGSKRRSSLEVFARLMSAISAWRRRRAKKPKIRRHK